MILAATFGVAVASATGYLTLAWISPAPANWPQRIVRACLSVVVGTALHSLWQFPWVALSAQRGNRIGFLFFDLALPCVLLANLAVSRGRRSSASPLEEPAERAGWPLRAAATAIGVGVVLAWTLARMQPHGAWDAWAIWNFKARWLVLGGSPWSEIVTNAGLATAHPDYPLLLPFSVARLWLITGGVPASVPEAFGVGAAALAAALVTSGTWWLRGARSAAVAGAGVLMMPGFLRASASQLADVPLACCYVAALVSMAVGTQTDRARWFTVAGLCAGAAIWTKNEGALFAVNAVIGLLVAALVASAGRREALRSIGAFAAGLVPFLVASAVLRATAIPNDLIANQSLQVTWGRLTTPARHAQILQHLASLMRSMPDLVGVVTLAAYLGLTGLARELRAGMLVAGTLALTACGYYAAYAVTPYDLAWHLDTSADRLVVQLWPSMVFAALLLTREPTPVPANRL